MFIVSKKAWGNPTKIQQLLPQKEPRLCVLGSSWNRKPVDGRFYLRASAGEIKITERLENMLREGSHWHSFEAAGISSKYREAWKPPLLKCLLARLGLIEPRGNHSSYLVLPTQFSRQNSWCSNCGLKWLNAASGWWENYCFSFGDQDVGKSYWSITKQNFDNNLKSGERKQSACWPWRTLWKSIPSDFAILFKILYLLCLDRLQLFYYLFHLYFLSGFISLSSWFLADVLFVLTLVTVCGQSGVRWGAEGVLELPQSSDWFYFQTLKWILDTRWMFRDDSEEL